jgi:hypothetical protein
MALYGGNIFYICFCAPAPARAGGREHLLPSAGMEIKVKKKLEINSRENMRTGTLVHTKVELPWYRLSGKELPVPVAIS